MTAVEIPEEVVAALKLPEDEREAVIREELAVALYDRGALSFGKARELAGCSAREFTRVLGERGVTRHYTTRELDEDIEYARE